MQVQYAEHRASGLGKAAAARAAGYAASSSGVVATRLEKSPEIQEAITKAREALQPGNTGTSTFQSAADYLLAVALGQAVPDAIRVSAAKAILPYERAKTRVPVKSATPREIASREALSAEAQLLEDWARTAARVRERLKRERTGT